MNGGVIFIIIIMIFLHNIKYVGMMEFVTTVIKLIHFYDAKKKHLNCDELYDLQKDPNELNNLYGDIKYKKIQDRLQKRLDSYRIELKVDEY